MNLASAPSIALLRTFPQGTEGRIIANVRDGLIAEGLSIDMIESYGRLFDLTVLRAIARSNLLIVHSALAYAVIYAGFARLLNKPVVGIVWDHYPVTIGGQRYDRSLRRRLLDTLENLATKLCSHLIVPSRDFLAATSFARAKVIPFWLPGEAQSRAVPLPGSTAPETFRLIFAGQVNETRALEEAYRALEHQFGGQFELFVASRDPLPHGLSDKTNITHLGFLDRAALQREMVKCDAGLVSLASQFDGPGLPSKTWEYLEAGLPCVYVGKPLPDYIAALETSGAGVALTADCLETDLATRLRGRAGDISAATHAFSGLFELDSAKLAYHLRAIAGAKPTRAQR